MNQKKQPSYYAIIPSTVRYDKRLKLEEDNITKFSIDGHTKKYGEL